MTARTTSTATAASSASRPSARWSQERRLEFIDYRLRWDGRLNRSDLIEFFGISVPQASLDIARYTELAPSNICYDASARTVYCPVLPSRRFTNTDNTPRAI